MIDELASLAGWLRAYGSDNPSFDALMLLGPVVVFAIVVAGRDVITTAMAIGYVVAFVVAIVYNAARSGDDR